MVKIYTTPTCQYCLMAKQFFKTNNVQYEETDVLVDLSAREEMVKKSHQMGVPVIDIGGEIVVGFDRANILKILKEKGLTPNG